MIRTEAAIITGTCYAQQIAHNEYLSQFFVCNNNHKNGNSVSKSDLRGVVNFLKCIGNHGGNDISKKKAQKCVDNYLA